MNSLTQYCEVEQGRAQRNAIVPGADVRARRQGADPAGCARRIRFVERVRRRVSERHRQAAGRDCG